MVFPVFPCEKMVVFPTFKAVPLGGARVPESLAASMGKTPEEAMEFSR